MMEINFRNKTVLVTGATRGIGFRIANDMLEAGAKVIATGTTQRTLELLNDDFTKFSVDFSNPDSTQKLIDFLDDKQIDVCVNNAGINKISPINNINQEDWNTILEVNLTAPFRIMKAVTASMVKNNYGRVVNVSSIWGNNWKRTKG